jgi:hypothetical protein
MAMTTFSYVSTVLTQVNITKPCLIGGLSTGIDHLWKVSLISLTDELSIESPYISM